MAQKVAGNTRNFSCNSKALIQSARRPSSKLRNCGIYCTSPISLFQYVAYKVFDQMILMFLHPESVQSTVSRIGLDVRESWKSPLVKHCNHPSAGHTKDAVPRRSIPPMRIVMSWERSQKHVPSCPYS